jgi:TRAP-type uncharacterized transport system substrate-binding protein
MSVIKKLIITVLIIVKSCTSYPVLASTTDIKIASGRIDGLYYKTAAYICQEIKHSYKKECEVVVTKGSLENITLLKSNKVNLAIIQSDLLEEGLINFGEIYKEGVFIVYNKKHDITNLEQFDNLYTQIEETSGDYSMTKKYISSVRNKNGGNKDIYSSLCDNTIDYRVFTLSLFSDTLKAYLSSCELKIFSFPPNFEKSINISDIYKLENKIYIPYISAILVGKNTDINYEKLLKESDLINSLHHVKVSKNIDLN